MTSLAVVAIATTPAISPASVARRSAASTSAICVIVMSSHIPRVFVPSSAAQRKWGEAVIRRGLDHIVHAVRDLDAVGERYAALGFTVGARNKHPWGTHNRIVQFQGVFIELLAVGEADLIP